MDSSGLSVLIEAWRLATSEGGGVSLAAPQAPVARILRTTGLDRRIKVYSDVDSAVGGEFSPPRVELHSVRALRSAAMDLNGAAAIISGGASGLGEATARDLAAHGATVVIADLNEERGKALADELGGVFVKTDVSDETQVQAAVDAAVATGKPLRVVVNSAGIGWASGRSNRDGSPHDLASYRKVIEVNLIGTFNLMRIGAAAIAKTEPADADGQRGVVINTASVAALEGQTGQVAYSRLQGRHRRHDRARRARPGRRRRPGQHDLPRHHRHPDLRLLARTSEEFKAKLVAPVVFPKRMGRAGGVRPPGALADRERLHERRGRSASTAASASSPSRAQCPARVVQPGPGQ